MFRTLMAVALAFSVGGVSWALAEEVNLTTKAIETKRDPSKYHTPDKSAQMMFGGAKYYVVGPIQKIDGSYYYIKDEESGEPTRVVMDEGTRVICSLQTASGPNGDCAMKAGDRVRAEVSDLGTVTTVRKLPPEEKMPIKTTQRTLGDILNIASPFGDYVVLPASFGSLRDMDPKKPAPVKSPDGKTLGTLHKLIMDSGSGRIQYAVVRGEDGTLVPIPWADLTIAKENGAYVLNNRGYKLEPAEKPKIVQGNAVVQEAEDRSPKMDELRRLIQQLQDEVPADLRAQDQGKREGQGKDGGEQKAQAQQSAQQSKCPDAQSVKGDVVKGKVVNADNNFLILKDDSGNLVHVHRDQCTRQTSQRIRTGLFIPGDTVEAYVTPQGHAMIISMLRPATYASFPDQ